MTKQTYKQTNIQKYKRTNKRIYEWKKNVTSKYLNKGVQNNPNKESSELINWQINQ